MCYAQDMIYTDPFFIVDRTSHYQVPSNVTVFGTHNDEDKHNSPRKETS